METQRPADEFHDFQRQSIIRKLGGFSIIKKPLSIRILHISILVVLYLLFTVTFIMTFITVVLTFDHKAVMAQAMFTVATMSVASSLLVEYLCLEGYIQEACELVRRGIFHYNEPMEDEYSRIRRRRVREMRQAKTIMEVMFCSSGFASVFLFPLMTALFAGGDQSSQVNPYLPIPLYLPFKTDSALTFSLLFVGNAITMMSTYTALASHTPIYVSCALYITGEFEVLNHSLVHMEERAYARLMKTNNGIAGKNLSRIELYDEPEFQEMLVYCLRQNILHHQAILRFKNLIWPFMAVTNTTGILLFSLLLAVAIIVVMEDISRNIFMTVTLGGTLLGYLPMCYFAELIANTSVETLHSLYNTPWIYSNKHFRQDLKIFITNTMEPLILKAAFFAVKISLETFGELISGGYKVTNVLR